ncbi:MAG: DUF5911 domain-containing protein [Actinomycetota bacterium]|nr:DUF5911 domain-containing protein [Actinomycetota bacterium]
MSTGFDGRTDPFPPIESYALLADGETTALVAPHGAVEWLCAPRTDSPSLFAAVLDRDAGAFQVAPTEAVVPVARRYPARHLGSRDHLHDPLRVAHGDRRAAGRALGRRDGR